MSDLELLPQGISKLVGGYDKQLQMKQDMGCLGEIEKECYLRFVNDLKRTDWDWIFDDTEVKRVLEFCSLLMVFDTNGNSVPLKLYPWQKFVVLNLFGWRNKNTKILRYREIYISIARRNGKSALSSVLLHYFMSASTFRSERAICFSVKKDSAMIVFRQFCQFCDADPDLAELYNVSKVNGNASNLGTDNYLEVFTGASNADGFQSGFAIADEVALQDGQLYKLIFDGQANLAQSQIIGITTAGFNLGGWCHKKYKGIKDSLITHTLPDNQFVYICEPDEDDNYSDPMTWAKANPLLFFTMDGKLRKDKIKQYQQNYQEALIMGGKDYNSFLTKQCNHWCAKSDSKLCDFDELENCFFDFTFEDVVEKYKTWYLGIDLAQVRDLNSIAFLTWIRVKDGKLDDAGEQKLYCQVINFMPASTLNRHIQADKFNYGNYIGTELFLTHGAKGERTDYGEIFQYLDDFRNEHELYYKVIACDPYGVASIQSSLEEITETLIMQSQHRKALSPYIELIATYVMDNTFAFSRATSDILMKAITNSVVASTEDGYLTVTKPTKTHQTNYRIDPVDALIDGMIAPILDRDRGNMSIDDIVDDWLGLYEERRTSR